MTIGIIALSIFIVVGFVLAERARKEDYERHATKCTKP